VYQDNDSYSRVLRQIEQVDPDIILLLETDRKWNRAMALLTDCYPFQESAIRNDTYGMMLMSRLEFEESSIHYRVLPDVPSVEALITVDATKIRLYGLHPKPPIPVEAFSSKSKDIELLKVANIIANRKNKEIALVIGDLNDVAWSRISMKMLDITGMVDPRKGRGFYSTFPVYSPFRIPLDHVFIEPQFELIDFRVMEDVGSDHFPVMIHLQLK
jgi:endonuclease/exonuclease/phosphatase (EEP) superfamily protein YafD